MDIIPIPKSPEWAAHSLMKAIMETNLARTVLNKPHVKGVLVSEEEWMLVRIGADRNQIPRTLKPPAGPEVGEFCGVKVYKTRKPIFKRFVTEQEYLDYERRHESKIAEV